VTLIGGTAMPGRIGGGPATTPVAVSTGMMVTISGGLSSVADQGGFVLSSQGGSTVSRATMTDAQGQFSFQKLPAGQYNLSVSRNQFLPTSYGQKRPGGQGTPFQLADGQQMKIALPMSRGGVVTGLVVGDDGEPQANAQIRAWRYMMSSGVRRLVQTGGGNTDDRGMYRLFGLQPGDYVIAAVPSMSEIVMPDRMLADMQAIEQAIASGAVQPPAAPGLPATVVVPAMPPQQGPTEMPPGYLPTYFPGTSMLANAATIHVEGGAERSGIDIQTQMVQASNIQGTIATPLWQGAAVQVSLQSNDPGTDGMSMPSTRAGQDGRFTLRNIAPGRYTVFAQTVPAPQQMTFVSGSPTPQMSGPPPQLDDSQKLWGRAAVSVEGQSNVSVSIQLQRGRSISGVVVFEMARMPDLSRTRPTVSIMNAPGAQTVMFSQPPQAQVGLDGRFTLTGVFPGKYVLRTGGGLMKSAMSGGQDVLDFPLEFDGDRDITDAVLTVTDTSSELSGTLTDAMGKPTVEYTVIAAAADTRFWTPGSRRIALARPGADGRYIFRSLPPGDYLLAAVSDLEPGGQYDPEFLKTLGPASMRVRIAEGAKLSQDLRIGR
jgi:protocatechuate 3,4-dioxygenase beta subunit